MKSFKKISLFALASIFAFGPLGNTIKATPFSYGAIFADKKYVEGSWTESFKNLFKPKVLVEKTAQVAEKPVGVIKEIFTEVTKEPTKTFMSEIGSGFSVLGKGFKSGALALGSILHDHAFFFSDTFKWCCDHPALPCLLLGAASLKLYQWKYPAKKPANNTKS